MLLSRLETDRVLVAPRRIWAGKWRPAVSARNTHLHGIYLPHISVSNRGLPAQKLASLHHVETSFMFEMSTLPSCTTSIKHTAQCRVDYIPHLFNLS